MEFEKKELMLPKLKVVIRNTDDTEGRFAVGLTLPVSVLLQVAESATFNGYVVEIAEVIRESYKGE